jgi:hypothetical protein
MLDLVSGLTFRRVFADNTFIALQFPRSVGTVLKPLGDAQLCMDLAFHHGDAGLIAVCDHLLQADLAIAEQGDERDKHGTSIQMRNDSARFSMQRLCQITHPLGPFRLNTERASSSKRFAGLVPVQLQAKNAADRVSAAFAIE